MYRLSQLEKTRRASIRGDAVNSDSDQNFQELLRRYTSWLDENRSSASVRLNDLETELTYEEFCLEEARADSRRHSVNGERRSTAETRKHAAEIERLQREESQLLQTNPDAFYVHAHDQLLRDMKDEHNGRLVNVPYLQRARQQIRTSLDAGIPVYLVGHLGSGKTQLAVECAEDYMRDHLLQEKLHEKMDAFRGRHPKRTRASELDYFEQIYPKVSDEVQKADCHPYFIAGSHDLTAEDMFFEKTLKLTHASGNASNGEELNRLISGFTSFLKENEGWMKDMKPDQQMELMLAGWKTFSQLYIAENTGYGTTVEKIEKEVLKAIREGRPIIIDEINTIAMANLIGLNDILQHHAGQTAYITGVGSVTIAEGFCLIGTGNLSTGTVTYEGTNILNPAFQSRFTTIVYNYVPQQTDGTLEDMLRQSSSGSGNIIISASEPTEDSNLNRENAMQILPGNKSNSYAGQNELFRLIIEHLCSEDGTLAIPNPPRSLPELWRLAQLARVSQNIFEGHGSTADGKGDTPVLNEAVLSIRNLIHVLDHWNFGEEEDLSMALWNGFLSSVTNADDRNLLLALAVRYGFFPEEEGWHIENRGRGDAALSYDEIRAMPYQHHILPLENLSAEDVAYLLSGKGPRRKSLSPKLSREIVIDEDAGEALPMLQKMDEKLRHLEHSALILEQSENERNENGQAENIQEPGKES